MRTAGSPDEIRRLIDEALEEIERTELEMLDLLSDVLGPENAKRVADEITAQGSASRFRRLLDSRGSVELPTRTGDSDRNVSEKS